MPANLQQVLREIDEGRTRPLYLVVGDEPFQAAEITQKLKAHFLKDENDATFNYESFDGEHLDGQALLASLDTLSGLFGGDSSRLVCCTRFDRAGSSSLEALDGYFKEPSPSTCFLMLAVKVDKRKAWVKKVEEKGVLIEIAEPYDRDWPRWQAYFERKCGKKIAPGAWECLVETSGRKLSILWAELQKAMLYVAEQPVIEEAAMKQLASGSGSSDVFDFADEVLCRRAAASLQKFHTLLKEGENEVKLLSILVRQFRMVSHYLELTEKGGADNRRVAAELGIHPFFVSRIQGQAKHQTPERLFRAIDLLAECDFRLKTGEGSLFEFFLAPYFSS